MVRPVVGISACRRDIEGRIHHVVQEKYATAVSAASGALPLLVPALGRAVANDDLLDSIDGLLLTGSPSNVLPRHYGQPASRPGTLHDPQRDETALPLVRRCIERAIPLLAVCRGLQEMNVAFGGTLHQHVHEIPGMLDHRRHPVSDVDRQYAPSHAITLTVGGMLHRLVRRRTFEVNSLHSQGIERLGDGLIVEARAPDGLVEAMSVEGCASFALAVQWHPEWNALEDRSSRALFAAFGAACRDFAERRAASADTVQARIA